MTQLMISCFLSGFDFTERMVGRVGWWSYGKKFLSEIKKLLINLTVILRMFK